MICPKREGHPPPPLHFLLLSPLIPAHPIFLPSILHSRNEQGSRLQSVERVDTSPRRAVAYVVRGRRARVALEEFPSSLRCGTSPEIFSLVILKATLSKALKLA
ncbi:unnamed protein product [Victoria cruziana]